MLIYQICLLTNNKLTSTSHCRPKKAPAPINRLHLYNRFHFGWICKSVKLIHRNYVQTKRNKYIVFTMGVTVAQWSSSQLFTDLQLCEGGGGQLVNIFARLPSGLAFCVQCLIFLPQVILLLRGAIGITKNFLTLNIYVFITSLMVYKTIYI